MQPKSRSIKAFITEFPTILLNKFPVAFECPVFVRFSLKLLHNLNTNTTHSSAQVLDNVKVIKGDFRRRKEFSGDSSHRDFLDQFLGYFLLNDNCDLVVLLD